MNCFYKSLIILPIVFINLYSSEYLKIINDIDSKLSEIESTSHELLVLCYSMYETTKNCDFKNDITNFDLNLKNSQTTIREYSNLLKLYEHLHSKNTQQKYDKNFITKLFNDIYLDAFNCLWNTRKNDLMEIYFSIQSNKIILRKWNKLNDLLNSVENDLIVINKKVLSLF